MPVISIIVPVYKVEAYLSRCIESILNQTFRDFELILVDDGSPDRCGTICDRYALSDTRIKVIHKENGGLSDARNAGLKAAEGEYLAFVDSDDFIAEDMYQTLLRELKASGADFIKSDFLQVSDVETLKETETRYTVSVYTPLQAIADFMETEYSSRKHMKSTVWDGLYRRNVFYDDNQLAVTFPKGKINEDTYIFPEIVFRAKKIAHVSQAFYYYYIREGSITSSKITESEINSADLWDHVDHIVSRHTQKYKKSCAFNRATRYLQILKRVYHSPYQAEYFSSLRKKLLASCPDIMADLEDVRVKRTLKVIRCFPLYLLLKRYSGVDFY